MKQFSGKFEKIMEDTIYRFQNGGLLNGDIVKIRKDALNNDKVKKMSDPYREIIKNAMSTDLNLRVSAVKSIRPNTAGNYTGTYGTDAPADYYVDVVVEYAPGLFRDPITVPMEILERVDTGINLSPIAPSTVRKNKETKPAKVTVNDGNRTNPSKNTKLEHTPQPKDGRATMPIRKPEQYKF